MIAEPTTYDLIVIGAGSAGLSAAAFASRAGARVALVEKNRVGGDCTWAGCIPSKALLHAAKVAHHMRTADRVGLRPVVPPADLTTVMAAVRAASERVAAFETPEVFAAQGIHVYQGHGSLFGAHTLSLDGAELRGRRFIISTGAQPAIPNIPGLASVPYLTYATVFQLEVLPRRLVVLGGGAIGVELAQAFQRLGSAVIVVEQADRLLPAADPEASAVLAAVLRGEGVTLRLSSSVERVEWAEPVVRVVVSGQAVEGDALLVATGRRPAVDGLDLQRAGVNASGQGIPVDDFLRTNQKHIYAAGDVTGGPQFTHYAGWQGFTAARNALLPGTSRGVRPWVPWVVFTDPEVGQIGLTEAGARQQFGRVRVERWPIERIDRAQTAGETAGLLKLVARQDGRLVGATVVSATAGEVANLLALAIEQRLTLRDLATTMLTYPTYGIGVQQAAAEAALRDLTGGWRGMLLRLLVRLRR